jgi:hypothetical protein
MRRRLAGGDSSLVAIERMRRRWAAARAGRLDLDAMRLELRRAFPGTETQVIGMPDFPGACRLFVWTLGGWRSAYAFDLSHVARFAAGENRIAWP